MLKQFSYILILGTIVSSISIRSADYSELLKDPEMRKIYKEQLRRNLDRTLETREREWARIQHLLKDRTLETREREWACIQNHLKQEADKPENSASANPSGQKPV